MKKCSHCGLLKDAVDFSSHPKTKDRLASWCKDCRSKDGNPQRDNLFKQVQQYKYDRGCSVCGENDPRVLDFHHPGKKEFTIGENLSKHWDEILAEIQLCIVVCANCHRKIHVKYRL